MHMHIIWICSLLRVRGTGIGFSFWISLMSLEAYTSAAGIGPGDLPGLELSEPAEQEESAVEPTACPHEIN